MTDNNTPNQPQQPHVPFTGTRRGDGGTYLIIADGSEEFPIVAHYAARLVHSRRAALAIAYMIDLEEFMHWGKVEAMIRHDLRQQAEKTIWQVAKTINEEHDIYSALYIREDNMIDGIIDIINEDKTIRSLILVGSHNANNQGPLVSYFSGKGMGQLRVPVTIVPGHLDKEGIEAIT